MSDSKNLNKSAHNNFDQPKDQNCDQYRSKRYQWLIDNIIPSFIENLKTRENINLNTIKAFEILSKADPSQNNSAVQWLCESYTKFGYLFEDIEGAKESKVFKTLSFFDQYKSKLTHEKRSLYFYNRLGDVYQTVEPYILNDNHKQSDLHSDASKQAIKRLNKLKAFEQSECFLKTDLLHVVVPLTEFASQWWGQGTQWCTASTNSRNYFDEYNQQAPLLICLIKPEYLENNADISELEKQNDLRKFQLWITLDKIQWTNALDNQVTRKFIHDNYKSFEPLISKLLDKNPQMIEYIPEQLITDDMVLNGLPKNIKILQWVPKVESFYLEYKLKLDPIIMDALAKKGANLAYIPRQIQNLKFCEQALKSDHECFTHISKDLYCQELCWICVQKDIRTFYHFDSKFYNQQICEYVVDAIPDYIKYVPLELLTEDLCLLSVEQKGLCLEFIPQKAITENICLQAVEQNGYALHYVPECFLTDQIYSAALKQKAAALKYIKKDLWCDQLYQIALKQSGYALKLIPDKDRTIELCTIAVNSKGRALEHVPQSLISIELCQQACEQDGYALQYVPDRFKNAQLYQSAIEQSPGAIVYVPVDYQTSDQWIVVIENNLLEIKNLPPELLNEQIFDYVLEKDARLLEGFIDKQSSYSFNKR